ncbi:MAG: ABC transporter substrate-binding protein [Aquabacterium sp.]
MNTRRHWIAAAVASPAGVFADALWAQSTTPARVAFLSTGGREGLDQFIDGMASLGWKQGTHYLLESRLMEGRMERLPALVQELAALKPAVFVAQPSIVARALAAAAPTTPIVLANGDPLRSGLVTNLARPGGMITGLSNVSGDLNVKLIELLVDAMPKLQRVGFVVDKTLPAYDAEVASARAAAERFRVAPVIVDVARPEDIEPAFASLARDRVQALVLVSWVWFGAYIPKMLGLAAAQRWPVASTIPAVARDGGLLAYGPDRMALHRRAAYYVDRILKGAKPGDLPIEQPTTFELVLNLKTAKALGVTMPRSIMARATEVIE